jgi:hypothetical protein
MTTEETTLGLTDIQHLLEESAFGNPAAYAGLSQWTFTRYQLFAAEPGGMPLSPSLCQRRVAVRDRVCSRLHLVTRFAWRCRATFEKEIWETTL